MPFKHAEAFCLMWYGDRGGEGRELIWNSRDGVTPFTIRGLDAREMDHVEFDRDRRAPGHIPGVGDRVFVDATIEDYVASRAVILSTQYASPNPFGEYLRKRYKTVWEAIQGEARALFDEHPGAPWIRVVNRELHEHFAKTRAERIREAHAKGMRTNVSHRMGGRYA